MVWGVWFSSCGPLSSTIHIAYTLWDHNTTTEFQIPQCVEKGFLAIFTDSCCFIYTRNLAIPVMTVTLILIGVWHKIMMCVCTTLSTMGAMC